MHLRPAASLAKAARIYVANIELEYGGTVANAKSILSVLTLGIKQGAVVTVTAEGVDANQAIHAIEDLFASFVAEMGLPAMGASFRR